jgi:hypothetical protein
VKEDWSHWWGSWTGPVTSGKNLRVDILLATFLDRLEDAWLWLGEEHTVDWGWDDIGSRWWTVDRAEGSGSRECWGGREVSVALGVEWDKAVGTLLHHDRRLVVLCARRCSWGKHWVRNIHRGLLVLDLGASRVWSLVHWWVVCHHMLGAGWKDWHWQAMRLLLGVWCEVAVLPVLRARFRVVVEKW